VELFIDIRKIIEAWVNNTPDRKKFGAACLKETDRSKRRGF
jgi:hypothetical protein